MKRHVLSALLLVAAFMPAMAEERSDAEMMAIARQQWGTQVKAFGQQAVPALTRVYDDAAVAVYSPENGESFVIVSRDDRMRPVLGHAAGRFDIEALPCAMKAWMAGIQQQLDALNAQPSTLRAPEEPEEDYEDEDEEEEWGMAPMVHSLWGQEYPYNALVPMDGDYPEAGCVAVAMAQVMNYWEWPARAQFVGRYTSQRFQDDGSGTLNMSMKEDTENINSTYQWPYAVTYNYYYPEGEDTPEWAARTEEENMKVATLIRDCGLAVNMRYQSNLASAYLPSAATALTEIFQYAPTAMRYLDAKYFTGAEWTALIDREISSGRPVIYGANDPDPANPRQHAFILHGITPDGLYRVNWGWYGRFNGAFALNALNTEGGNYSADHTMIIGICREAFPFDNSAPLLATESYTFTYTPDKRNQTLTASLTNLFNSSIQPFTGRLYEVIEDTGTGAIQYGDIFNQDVAVGKITDGIITGWGPMNGWPATIPSFANGHTYRVYLAYKDVREGSYQPVRTAREGGPIYYTLTIDAQGQGAISGPQFLKEYLVTTGVKDIKGQAIADDGITRVYDLQGRLVHTAPTASFNLWEVPARGVLVIKQGNDVRKVAR